MTSAAVRETALRPPSDAGELDFELPHELIQDAVGRIFCVVCCVYVPRGELNASQHMTGRRHASQAQRLSLSEQDSRRETFLQQVTSQRLVGGEVAQRPLIAAASEQLPEGCAPTSTHQSAFAENGTVAQTEPEGKNNEVPAGKNLANTSRARKIDRLKVCDIDKAKFLSAILRADDTNPGSDDDASESDSVSHDVDYEEKNVYDQNIQTMEGRRTGFQPMKYQPPPGQSDAFWDSMPEESVSETKGQKLKLALSSSTRKTPVPDDKMSKSDSPSLLAKEADFIALTPPVRSNNVDSPASFQKSSVPPKSNLINSNSTRNLEYNSEEEFDNPEQTPPWLIGDDAIEAVKYVNDPSLALHFEILDFERFISPTHHELSSRAELVTNVTAIVHTIWPHAQVEVFGSYATNLYLPSSDIDICILKTPEGGGKAPDFSEYLELAQAIRNVKGFARRINFIKAKVPLVKIVSSISNVQCDISFNHLNGPANVHVIRNYLSEFPALRPILLVLKCFLQQRSLNEVFSGGLGSYSVLLLVVSHLQMMGYNFPGSSANLGVALLHFFQLYGRMFNYCLAGIRVKDSGSYYDKVVRYQTSPGDTLRFSIEDPNDETNELGRNSYAASRIRKAFSNAFLLLSTWRRDDSYGPISPLSSILHVDDQIRDRASPVTNDFIMDNKVLQYHAIMARIPAVQVADGSMETLATQSYSPNMRASRKAALRSGNAKSGVRRSDQAPNNRQYASNNRADFERSSMHHSTYAPFRKRRRFAATGDFCDSEDTGAYPSMDPLENDSRRYATTRNMRPATHASYSTSFRDFHSRVASDDALQYSSNAVDSFGYQGNATHARLAPIVPEFSNTSSSRNVANNWDGNAQSEIVGYDPLFPQTQGIDPDVQGQAQHISYIRRTRSQPHRTGQNSRGRWRTQNRGSSSRGGKQSYRRIQGGRRGRRTE